MTDWITALLVETGYLGIILLMVAENLFPPIPSEVIMPFAGFVAAEGRLDPIGVVAAGTFGSVLGALPWYYAGHLLGRRRLRRLAARHGWWLTVTPADVDRAAAWFARRGYLAVFLCRLVPGLRTVISAPAGFAHLPLIPFLAVTAAGTAIWVAALTAAGYLLRSQYRTVADYVDPAVWIVLGLVGAVYLWRLITRRPSQRALGGSEPADEPPLR